ncbi:MAG: hypothetical protein C4532_06440 [Candidatus Abyssobacteria bacterium SURF_17]|uniref:Tetratricopeptide repeat protein n=1 Tax=Candidatus Abyssobacteria bacterium SURF_17 TaxID=2093361 RepID=A0A419F286_9BACT|nr:MAG: hypothetical protein C4532_06440 [Candidatus Abyssubacteria bacterium SURF_17]
MNVALRRVIIAVVIILGLSVAGCGDRIDRAMLKQANTALKAGNMKAATDNTKKVLQKNPRNLLARRLMSKIKGRLIDEAEASVEAKKYEEAVKKLEMLLELDPQHEKGKALLATAKKNVLLAHAREALGRDDSIAAFQDLKEALRLDPQFEEAKKLQVEAEQKAQEKIANLMATSQSLIEQEKFEELRKLSQDVLAIDPSNLEAQQLLAETQAQILSRSKEENLEMARKFYEETKYESALLKAEEVFKVDPNNAEAKELIQKSKAELTKPDLRLTGLSKLKGRANAHIEVPSTRERFTVTEGETFLGEGDFKVLAIDMDLRAVVVSYVKTGSQQTIFLASENLGSTPGSSP